MKTRKTLERYRNGLDFIGYFNFSGMLLMLAIYNPSPGGVAAVVSLGCINLAMVLIIRRKEMAAEMEAEENATREGDIYGR